MKLLLTGFKPFDILEFNPTEWLAERLQNQKIGKFAIQTAVLDVLWNETEAELLKLFDTHKPDYFLMTGVAQTRPVLNLEVVGINFRDFKKDNSGFIPLKDKIKNHSQNAYFSDLKVNQMLEEYKGEIPLERSLSAGGYLCNQVLFQALMLKEKHQFKAKIGFLHVPNLQNENLLKLLASVKNVIEVLD